MSVKKKAPAKTKTKAKAGRVTAAVVKRVALSFPEAQEKESYGRPAFFVAKKFFTRYRAEDDSLVFIVGSMEQRDMMLELDPDTYFITDHYKDYPSVLVRLTRITAEELQVMLERRWRAIAPKKLVKEIDEKLTSASPASARSSRARGSSSGSIRTTRAAKAKKSRK